MQFSVYILFSEKFNKHYVGFTSNLLMRFQAHNEFGKDLLTHAQTSLTGNLKTPT